MFFSLVHSLTISRRDVSKLGSLQQLNAKLKWTLIREETVSWWRTDLKSVLISLTELNILSQSALLAGMDS